MQITLHTLEKKKLPILHILIIFITIVADHLKALFCMELNEASLKQARHHLHFLYTKNIDYNPCRSTLF